MCADTPYPAERADEPPAAEEQRGRHRILPPGEFRTGIVARIRDTCPTGPGFSVGSVGAVVAFALMAGLVEEPGWRGAASFGSLRFWLTNLGLVELGVLFVWLTNTAGGSILVAVLAHAGFNAAGELVPRSTTGDVIAVIVVSVATVAVIAVTRGGLALDRAASEKHPARRSGRRMESRRPPRRAGS